MREVKFRGYSHSEGWVFGCYATDGVGYHAILMGDEEDESCMLNEHVERRSIGQYTGLKDKNGVEIYEGDICVNECGRIARCSYHEPSASFDFIAVNSIGDSYGYEPQMWKYKISVIGNIYGNPELLESDSD